MCVNLVIQLQIIPLIIPRVGRKFSQRVVGRGFELALPSYPVISEVDQYRTVVTLW